MGPILTQYERDALHEARVELARAARRIRAGALYGTESQANSAACQLENYADTLRDLDRRSDRYAQAESHRQLAAMVQKLAKHWGARLR